MNYAAMKMAVATPWGGLGAQVDPSESIDTWCEKAGLDWSYKTAPVTFDTGAGPQEFGKRSVVYRSDSSKPLSVVGKGYKLHQPGQILEFFRDVADSHGLQIVSAGSLDHGRKIWVQAEDGKHGEVAPGDGVRSNLLLATSCDGSMSTKAVWTAVRIRCGNALSMAIRKGEGTTYTHRSQFDPDAIKLDLGFGGSAFARFMDQARELSERPMMPEQARELLNKLMAKPVKLAASPQTVYQAGSDFQELMAKPVKLGDVVVPENRTVVKVLELFNGAGIGSQEPGSRGTAWGLLNAVTEYVDHHAGRSDSSRMDSAWFGRGDALKSSALQLIAKA